MSAPVGPQLSPQRRATAVRAFDALAPQDRRDVLALARQGRRHPDERVAAVAWWYAASVLQPRWYNRLPLAVAPAAALALLAAALLLDAWPVALLALLALLAGAGLARQRLSTAPLLRLMRPPGTDSGTDSGTGTGAGAGTDAGAGAGTA
ncbi:hypothetical protein GTQ99_22055 [Kineococcus sp. T13]|uniref:hypothetical protein n=1 Tax=Kineococcus vitellinus TaxID=2696565 RepID=UPI001411C634|nr:hypothetical protein [Kineococcus vitellinus]NAZ78070.1 hypothetical protein [Kineococcus vitellinus]